MKSIKFIACLAAGLVALGTLSAQAAGTLSISITTYQQTLSTNSSGVITYASKAVTIKNADILAKVASVTGIALPAGAKLAISTTHDTVKGIDVGDVVITDAKGTILFDLSGSWIGTGYVEIYVYGYDSVDQVTSTASKSTSYAGKGEGELYFDIWKGATAGSTSAVVGNDTGWYYDGYDNLASAQYTKGRYDALQLTTGSFSFSGGAELYIYDTGVSQPCDQTVSASAADVPWSVFQGIWNNND